MRSSIILWNSSGCTSEWINPAWNSRIWWFAVILQEEDTPELQKKIQSSLKIVANQFVDPVKAEDFLHKLYQMKDNSIFKSLAVLLNYSTTTSQAVTARVYLAIDLFFNLWVCLFVHCDYLNFGFFKVNLIFLRCPVNEIQGQLLTETSVLFKLFICPSQATCWAYFQLSLSVWWNAGGTVEAYRGKASAVWVHDGSGYEMLLPFIWQRACTCYPEGDFCF
jgi:hypothetical protein